jgi:triosephosphate isomerase
VFCCGEPLSIREADTQNAFVAEQLRNSLFHLSADQMAGIVIAYEPIWAIGTGKTATSEDAQEVCGAIRREIGVLFGAETAQQVRIQYGGSVKAANIAELMLQPDIDGALVGGASLDPDEFARVIQYRLHQE